MAAQSHQAAGWNYPLAAVQVMARRLYPGPEQGLVLLELRARRFGYWHCSPKFAAKP